MIQNECGRITSASAASSEAERAAPVGLQGEQSTIAFVCEVIADASASGRSLYPSPALVSTMTGVAPASLVCSG